MRSPHLLALRCMALLMPAVVAASVDPPAQELRREVVALDIDRLGPVAFAALRDDARLTRFIELGDRALVEAAPDLIEEQARAGHVLGRIVLGPDQFLSVHPRLHCGGGPHEIKHHLPDLFGDAGPWHVQVRSADSAKREAGEFVPAARDRIAWQLGNRPAPKAEPDPTLAALAARVDAQRWRTDLERLASFDRQNAAGFGAALDVVQQRFESLGLQTRRECFAFTPPYDSDGRNCNVQAVKPGSEPGWVIVGAHLDSRNAGFSPLLPSPGAEDNASGCAAVMEAARLLADRPTRRSLLFQCYGLEELGLHGSRAHAATLAPASVAAMINLDMIAYEGDGRLDLSISSRPEGSALVEQLGLLAQTYTTLEVELATATCCSDHVPYLDRGIPAALLIQGDFEIYAPYHTVNDRPSGLSTPMAVETIRLATVAAASLAGAPDPVEHASGYWYTPAMSGQGWHFERQADGSAVAAWYSFDADGERLWLSATGSIRGDTATLAVRSVDGGRFPPQFDPAQVSSAPWGTLTFRFIDCATADVSWQPLPETGLPAGSAQVVRLTRPSDTACEATPER